ncbi:MAG: hypothetical protein J0L61_08110 [Planctomycetes bacterium]|nr:hypothetical protein [Planctomycetota bacterium]
MPRAVLAVFTLAVLLIGAPRAGAQTSPTAFTYQGRISLNGAPFSGTADVRFQVFDAAEGGNAVTGPLTIAAVQSSAGLFTATLDFGAPVAGFPERWLEITVTPAGGGDPVTLAPRQQIKASPASTVAFSVPVFSGEPIVPFKGMVRFNDLLADFQGFNGFFWVSLTGKPNAAYTLSSFTANNTFTVPAGVTRLFVEVWGGGGGGGGTVNASPLCAINGPSGGISGGSGGYASSVINVTPGEQLTVTVGTRGIFGLNSPSQTIIPSLGGPGGQSAVTRAGVTLLSAAGGQGGTGGAWANWATDCALGPNDFVLRPSGEGGAASGGNIANIQGPSASPISKKANFCDGCCTSGVPEPAPATVASALAQLGLPGTLSTGAGRGGGGARGPISGSGCATVSRLAENGQLGEVRIYWTTAP